MSGQQPARAPVTVPDPRALPRILPPNEGPSLAEHLGRWGSRTCPSNALIQEVRRAGLRGKGGAGFPTGIKLQVVADGRRRPVVVVNGTEGEPTSAKDKVLMTAAPHLVLDGASMAAKALDAVDVVICIDRAATGVIQAVRAALGERRHARLDPVPLRVEATPTRYITGEESALVHWLNGGEAKPVFTPPRPYDRGVAGRPTLVDNAETLAHVALIARYGAGWYGALGLPDDPGTSLLTISGDVVRPGVYEVPLGIALREATRAAGRQLSGTDAVLLGGYFGTWLSGAAAQEAVLARRPLQRLNAGLGCGSLVVLGGPSCGLIETARATRWLAGQSAGQCGPCTNGLPAIADAVEAVAAGDRSGRWERFLHWWLDMVDGRGACHHPSGVVRFVRSGLAVFADEIAEHRRRGPCPAGHPVLPVPHPGAIWR